MDETSQNRRTVVTVRLGKTTAIAGHRVRNTILADLTDNVFVGVCHQSVREL
jgi:hypothetical protein